jgi:hypothetical protein
MAVGLRTGVARSGRNDTKQQSQSLDLFAMANLFPRTTGLPMTVWVSPRGRARHDARVKVCLAHGPRMDISNTAIVGIRPQPRRLRGQLPAADFEQVAAWIALNEAALPDFWNGEIDAIELGARLRTVGANEAG